jgi:uncharacterized SAM-binding protein YcdF (DUF218 family)
MFLYLSKLLPALVLPPGLTILLLLAAAILRKRRPRWATALVIVAIGSLYALSIELVAAALQRNLESSYPAVDISTLPKSDAIVVLGGYLRPAGGGRRYNEFMEASDRIWMGAMLYRAGKAPVILLTGGNVGFLGTRGTPEAIAAKQLLEQWGVPEDAILVEPKSLNTHENAAFSKVILASHGARQLLLVTSAMHMQRAAAIFRREGMQVTPVATDYQTGWGEPDLLFQLVPDADTLAHSKNALREWIGLTVYRLRGWA